MSKSVSVANKAEPITAAEAAGWFADLSACNVLVLAASGGPDSTALCLLAARWRTALKEGPALLAVTVDHGLRPEARREAATVKQLAVSLGIPHRTVRWTGPKPATGLQEAARTARYRLLAAAAQRAGARHVLTAHTLDDQAETVLFRLARGSGLSGLAGMARVSPLPLSRPAYLPSPFAGEGGEHRFLRCEPGEGEGGLLGASPLPPFPTPRFREAPPSPARGGGEQGLWLLRPFLHVPKARLIATLAAAQIPYAADPSNRDPRFARARLREIMPALAAEGLTAGRLAGFARRARRANEAIEAAVDGFAEKLVPPLSAAAAAGVPAPRSLSVAEWVAAPEEIRLRLLGRMIAASGDEGPVELGKLESCEQALADHMHKRPNRRFRRTLAGAVVTVTRGRLIVGRAPPRRKRRVVPEPDARTPADVALLHQPSAK